MMIFLIFLFYLVHFVAAQDDCLPTRCHDFGPIIRFPFRLKGRQPEHCGYPGFDLSCNPINNSTEFEFQFPVKASTKKIVIPLSAKASVQEIDYRLQVIHVSVINGSCLPKQVPIVSSPASPFQMFYQYNVDTSGFTLFNCSAKPETSSYSGPITCLGSSKYQVYAFRSYYSISDFSLSNCVKMYNISDVSEVIFRRLLEYRTDDTQLHWSTPFCGNCEATGKQCRFKNNSMDNETRCFDFPKQPEHDKGASKKGVIVCVSLGLFLLVLVVLALYCVYRVKKRNENKRIGQFLEDYKTLRPARYSYADINKITNGFRFKLGEGGYGTVFKGKLSNDILVAVKVLNNIKGNGEEFINEVSTIGKIHHVNVVRLVGYCADGYRRALVYEFLPNDSLDKYISSGKQNHTLGWEKLHKIALGIAKGIDYLHQGCNQRILHFDIKPHNILLDHNLNPRVADFGLAKICSKDQSVVTMTAARGTIGYIAPEVFSRNFGNVSYKSDIYSFGMLLLDLVGGRKNFNARANDSSEVYFPEWMYNQLDKGEEIEIEIEKDNDTKIAKRLIIVGLWCIQWYPADRPSMKVVIQMLEGENMPVMPPNPFAASESANINSSAARGSLFCNEFDSISEQSVSQ
ncbi:Protein kinase superfamily protein [Abeliophyllum distichum]|uniref:Protein kinase superfamily protein n=1 Tax=Abeliophyllum distichum TaxID=126358 RepID=A0ABD1UQY7_9LAMI